MTAGLIKQTVNCSGHRGEFIFAANWQAIFRKIVDVDTSDAVFQQRQRRNDKAPEQKQKSKQD